MSPDRPAPGVFRRFAPGLAAAGVGAAIAYAIHLRVPELPILSVAIVLGLILGNVTGFRQYANRILKPGLESAAAHVLPAGIIMLGLTLSVTGPATSIALWSLPFVLGVAAVSFAAVYAIGKAFRLPGDEPLVLAQGFALGSGSFSTGSKKTRPSKKRSGDITVPATAAALIAVVVLPELARAAGFGAAASGFWAGTAVPGAGQAIAAGGAVAPGAASIAAVVVTVRLFLVAVVALIIDRRSGAITPAVTVVGFAVAMAIGSAGILSGTVTAIAAIVGTVLVAAALISLGASVKLSSLTRLRPKALAAGASAFVFTAALAWVGALFI